MANPRLVYNSIDLDFPNGLTAYRKFPNVVGSVNESTGGVVESVINQSRLVVEIGLENFDDAAFFRSLHAWWAWARQGQQYAFAFDSADMVSTLLDAAAASGQKVIPVTSTTGFAADGYYLIRSADRLTEEIVQVDTIQAGISITTKVNLIYGYVAGDTARSIDYFPKVKSLDQQFPVRENPVLTYNFEHKMLEDLG